MYGGAAVANNAAPQPLGGMSASPIPQTWWDQDQATQNPPTPNPATQTNNHTTTGPPHTPIPPPPTNNTTGGSAMDAAAATIDQRGYYRPGMRAASPNIQQRLDAMGVSGGGSAMGSEQGQQQQQQQPPIAGGMAVGGRGRYDPFAANAPAPNGGANGTTPSPGGAAPSTNSKPNVNGLIRLTLKKPMGIVFEPMVDPHNPSQERGVRICVLPRTGAAALSRQLEIGDNLLSINDKTMSRLTFDEIMDFIFEADAENVNLLFRRPKKDASNTVDAGGAPAKKDTVKWVDGNTGSVSVQNNNAIVTSKSSESEESKINRKKRGGRRGESKDTRHTVDEESIISGEDTYYTQETEVTRRRRRHNRGGSKRRSRSSDGWFFDMLIDTICPPMSGDPERGKYSDDDSYNSADDDTFVTNDETYDGTYDSGSYVEDKRRRASQGRNRGKWKQDRDTPSPRRKQKPQRNRDDHFGDPESKDSPPTNTPQTRIGQSRMPASPPPPPKVQSNEDDDDAEPIHNTGGVINELPNNDPSSRPSSRQGSKSIENKSMAASTTNKSGPSIENKSKASGGNMSVLPAMQETKPFVTQSRFEPQITPPEIHPPGPIAQLEYDPQNYAADVSVMESVGGPSLLIESMNRAAPPPPPVSSAVMNRFGFDYRKELGLSREETIRLDPNKFYRHVVKGMLEDNEPEKVRLLDKLFAKYSGREEHLILKLSARYAENVEEEESAKSNKENSMTASNASHTNSTGHSKSIHSKNTSNDNTASNDNDGFEQFGGFPKSKESSGEEKSKFNNSSGWPDSAEQNTSLKDRSNSNKHDSNSVEDDESQGGESQGSKSMGSESYETIDGSSPAVIAQVSELLNYVYGKTSVPGQIDRVSTIMRAYEGREAVLLELLETKALLKANADETTDNLPEYLRRNPGLQNQGDGQQKGQVDPGDPDLELPQDDLSSDEGRSSRSDYQRENGEPVPLNSESTSSSRIKPGYEQNQNQNHINLHTPQKPIYPEKELGSTGKKKKKGLFGSIFKKNKKNSKNKDSGGAFPSSDGTDSKKNRSLMSPRGGKKGGSLLRKEGSDVSI